MQIARSYQLACGVIGCGDALSGIEGMVRVREQSAPRWLTAKCNPACVFQVPGICGCMNQLRSLIKLLFLKATECDAHTLSL
jgi:hypothetical protein